MAELFTPEEMGILGPVASEVEGRMSPEEAARLNKEMSYGPGHPVFEETASRKGLADTIFAIPEGFFLGGADELLGAMPGQNIDEIRRLQAVREKRNPSAAMAGRFIGSALASMVPLGAGLQVARNAGLGVKSVVSALMGGGIAATQGALEADPGKESVRENMAGRFAGAVEPLPLGIGIVTGGTIPVAGRIAGTAARQMMPLPGEVLPVGLARSNPAMRAAGFSPGASNRVARAFESDATMRGGTREMEDYLNRLGPEGTLADAGPSLEGVAGGVVAKPGPGKSTLHQTMVERQRGTYNTDTGRYEGGAAERINTSIDDALGTRQNIVAVRESMDAARRAQAKSAYDTLYQTNVPLDAGLMNDLRHAHRLGALKDASNLAAARSWTFDADSILRPGSNAVEIKAEAVDLISRALRDRANAAWREGKGELGKALGELNDRLLDRVPELRNIRRRYADDMSMRTATEEGGDLFNNTRLSADQFAADWANRSPAEQAAWRLAARDAIEQKLAGNAFEASAGRRVLLPRTVSEKIRVAFGNEAEDAIFRRIDAERLMAESGNRTINNSMTASRALEARETGPLLDAAGNPAPPHKRLLNKVYEGPVNSAWNSLSRTRPEVTSRDLGRAMSLQGSERDRVVQALIADQLRRQQVQDRGAGVEAIARRLLSAGVGPAALQARKTSLGGPSR